MALYVHHGTRLAALADGVVQRLAAAGGDPFERLVVAVPTAGVRDWLTRRIATDLGVAANVALPYPASFFAAALGVTTDDDPWTVERLTWAVLDVLESGAVEVPGWQAASVGAPSRRFAVARRIADLFDRYAATRPEVLRQWRDGIRGDGTIRATTVGGTSAPGDEITVGTLPAAMRWQFELWQRVRRRIGEPGPAEVGAQRVDQLRAGELVPALPRSVELFGTSAVSRPQLDVLAALATGRDVHVSLLHPSPLAWTRTPPIDVTRPTLRRQVDVDTVTPDRHPLLQSWGRHGDEAAALVRGVPPAVTVAAVAPTVAPPATLLAHVQADLEADRHPTPFARSPTDRSIRVHACHGTVRQLEVLRDALGHLFVSDPALRPDDVLVICPDLARFAPFIAPVFARGTLPVPVTVSDLSLATENDVAAALTAILRTVAGRCTASDVLAVAALDPVRRRLDLTGDDLERFAEWCARLGTSWGLDATHRAAWLRSGIGLGTWEEGLRSLLLGAAMPAPEARTAIGGITPFDDVGGDDVARAGRLAELVVRLGDVRRSTHHRLTVDRWCDLLADVVERLCAPPPREPWQMAAVFEAIDDVRRTSSVAGAPSTSLLAFDDLLAIVDGVFAHRPGRLQLRTGAVAVTGNAAVRNVPAKVVCVLGFDESSVRPAAVDGDDLLAIRPCVGERDRQAERRHLLLDALLAAEQALLITCDGSDVTTNRPVRFAVPLSELLDVIDATLEPAGSGQQATTDDTSPVLVRHPLHSYDEANFDLASAGRSLSFDDRMCHAAEIRRQRVEQPGAATWQRFRVDAEVPVAVTLAQLVDACVRPARILVRDGLGVRLSDDVEPVDHAIPLSVSKLEAAAVGRRLLARYQREAARLRAGEDVAAAWELSIRAARDEWADAERLAAGAPPGRLIEETLDGVAEDIDAITAVAETCGLDTVAVLGADETIDVDIELAVRGIYTPRTAGVPDKLHLSDRVTGTAERVLCRIAYRRPRPGHVVAAAIDLAAVVVATGDPGWRAVAASRPARGAGKPQCHLFDVNPDDPVGAAHALLETAAELRVAALSGPLPLFETTTQTLFETGVLDEEALVGTEFRGGDLDDDGNRFVWGDVAVAELAALEPSPRQLAQALWGAVDAFVSMRAVGERAVRRS
jgi:exodeoxyribonuclease V gamma subunit